MHPRNLLTTLFLLAEVFGAAVPGREMREGPTKRQLPDFRGRIVTSRPLVEHVEAGDVAGNITNGARFFEDNPHPNCETVYERKSW